MATIKGTKRDDEIDGSNSADVIDGLGGDDSIYGYDGRDVIRGGDGLDYIVGGAGDDVLRGGTGDDIMYGDELFGGVTGNDKLYGDDGNDLLRSSLGVDFYDGGEGTDRISFGNAFATQGAVVNLATQIIENDSFGNREEMVSIEDLGVGTLFVDRFYGSDGANFLWIDTGDTAMGYAGDDTISIGSIKDTTVSGGIGDDFINFVGQSQYRTSSGGLSYLNASQGVSVDLGRQQVLNDGFGNAGTLSSVENVSGASLADRLVGNGGANHLDGDAGNDVLIGAGGNDVLIGWFGSDTLTGGKGADVFKFDNYDLRYEEILADTITDFDRNDLMDISDITVAGVEGTFAFIGKAAFSGAAGEVRYEIVDGQTIVQIEADGVAGVDHTIVLTDQVRLNASDFVL